MCAVTRAADVDYLTHIKPALRERCFACHGAVKQEGGLRLDTATSVIKGVTVEQQFGREKPTLVCYFNESPLRTSPNACRRKVSR